MITPENISIVMQIATLLGIIYAVYNSFRKPQEQGEINDKVFDEKFANLTKQLETIKNNDLHELKGMFNTHVLNQNANEREVSDKIARLDTKLDFLLKK